MTLRFVGRTVEELRDTVHGHPGLRQCWELLTAITNDYGFSGFVCAYTDAVRGAADSAVSAQDARCLRILSAIYAEGPWMSGVVDDQEAVDAVTRIIEDLEAPPDFMYARGFTRLLRILRNIASTPEEGGDPIFCLAAYVSGSLMSNRAPTSEAEKDIAEQALLMIDTLWHNCYGEQIASTGLFGPMPIGSAD